MSRKNFSSHDIAILNQSATMTIILFDATCIVFPVGSVLFVYEITVLPCCASAIGREKKDDDEGHNSPYIIHMSTSCKMGSPSVCTDVTCLETLKEMRT